jgi:hypothetical protein
MIKDKYIWVKNKLTAHPALRDSNERLYYHYLLEIGYDIDKPTKEFLKDMEKRVIPYMDAFGRASRKVQEEHPHLRGTLWQKRKTVKEPEIRQEIRDLT